MTKPTWRPLPPSRSAFASEGHDRACVARGQFVGTGSGRHWTFGVHARNLTDKRCIVSGYKYFRVNPFTGQAFNQTGPSGSSSSFGKEGSSTAFYSNPRQIFSIGYES
jgi:hypothetical protein